MKRLNVLSLLLGLAVAVPIAGCSQTDIDIMTKAGEPAEGDSCSDMQDYFNKNFGRSDTTFSNYEGTIQPYGFPPITAISCFGGVVIQSFPTGKKTCPGQIVFDTVDKRMKWYADSSADCFVSQ